MSMLSRRRVLGGVAAAVGTSMLNQVRAADAPAGARKPSKSPPFELGLVTYNVANAWDVPTIIKVCTAAGVAAVELRTTHKHGVEPTLSKAERAEVKKRFADSPVKLWGLGSTCEFHAPDAATVEKQIETCKQFVDLAADVGAAGVKVRPNAFPKGVSEDKTLEQIGKSLVPCGKAAESAGVEIWVEVHGRGTSHPPHMKTMMEQCGHPKVGVTWNSNPTDLKDGQIAGHFAMLRPWILSCHINDLWEDAAGQYPYRELFKLLTETGYDRYTLIEVGTAFPDPKAGEAFLRHYKALWATLAAG